MFCLATECFLKIGLNGQLKSHKNLDFWHFSGKMERSSNTGRHSCPVMIGRTWEATFKRVTCSPVRPNIILSPRPVWLRFLLPAWPHDYLHMCLCSRFPSPLEVRGRHLGGGGFRIGPWKKDMAVVQFSFTGENFSEFYTPFLIPPLFPLLVSRTAQHFCHLCLGIRTARVPVQSLSFAWWVNLETWTSYLTSQITLLQNGDDTRIYLIVLSFWGVKKRHIQSCQHLVLLLPLLISF